ncbi:MAG: hypothetical protein ABIU85_00740, partial [Methylotenera sp.]
MSNYNLNLIILSMLVGYFAVQLTFSLVSRLYKSETVGKKPLLIFSTIIVGSSFWAIHFLDVLAFPLLQSTGFILSDIVLSWLTALVVSLTILDVSSKKTLPLESLVASGFLAGIGGYVMFYFSINSMQIQPAITFSLSLSLIAVIVSIAVAMLGIMIMFWLKNYSGELPSLTKSMFAIIMSMAINGVHLTYNAAIEIPPNAFSNTAVRFDNNLLGVTIALGFICLLLITFVVAIFYDKFGYNTFKFNLFKKENEQELTNLAMLDTLTQLPNRRAFQQYLESAIKRST